MSGPFGSSQWMYNSGGSFYGYEIDNSLRGNEADSPYLNRTPSSASNRKTYTISAWIKPSLEVATFSILGAGSSGSAYYIFGIEGDDLYFEETSGGGFLRANRKLRDPSAWYHLMAAVDSTQATAANRIKLYVNGIQETSFSSETYMSQNRDSSYINNTSVHYIGHSPAQGSHYLNGYIAEVNFIDGTALDPTSFGETKSGIWIPKAYSGSYGTNGFYLEFNGNSNDSSGNSNNWTANNISAHDYIPDSPTNNFAVVPSTTLKSTGYSQHTEGNLQLYQPSWGGWDINLANFNLPSSGKYYWEVMPVQGIFNAGAAGFVFGIGNIRGRENISGYPTFGNPLIQVDSRGIGEYRQEPAWVNYTISGNFGFTVGSTVYGIAVDCDAKKFWFSLDNSWAGTSGTTLTAGTGDPANGTNGDPISGDITDYVPFFNLGDQQSSCKMGINFGQDSTFAGATAAGGNADENGYGDFKYAPPSGFLSLCSANLPSGAIDTLADETPEDYFNTVLYTGTGATQSITGVGFQPDWVWLKRRSSSANHTTLDAVRGATKTLEPNVTGNEETQTQSITSFDSDGWTIGSRLQDNQSGGTYVSWNWLAGNGTSSNTDGSITSTVSVGATSQQPWFSIVGYTGDGISGTRTIGCGLEKKPDYIILKNRTEDNVSDTWFVYGTPLGSASPSPYLTLYNEDAVANSGVFVDTAFSDNGGNALFAVSGSYNGVNKSGTTYIAYCFANAEGLCKVGKYTGNGSSDGTFVYTGFRPAFVMVKRTDSGGRWVMWDNRRSGFNVDNDFLYADDSNSEFNGSTYVRLDLTSNGFKMRDNSADTNGSGASYIFLSIAEQPFKYANAR